jgi:hypothetical protein
MLVPLGLSDAKHVAGGFKRWHVAPLLARNDLD